MDESVLIPMYKGKGDSKECGNYRGIKPYNEIEVANSGSETAERRSDRRPIICIHATKR